MDSKLLSNENMSLKAKFLRYMIPSVLDKKRGEYIKWIRNCYQMKT